MKEVYYYTWDGLKYRYRHDPVPYCGVYRRRKPMLPYNRRTRVLNSIQEEEHRPFKDPVYKEVVSRYGGGCIHCYRYLIRYERHTDRCWKTNYKCRKQWMKHLKKHYPSIRIQEELNDLEEFENAKDNS